MSATAGVGRRGSRAWLRGALQALGERKGGGGRGGVVPCGVVSAAPELDINKACGECKQRAEEVAMGVRGLGLRTSTVGVVSDKDKNKNNNNGGPGRTERLLAASS